MVKSWLSQKQRAQICQEALGSDYANPEKYPDKQLGFPESEDKVPKSVELSKVARTLEAQVQANGFPDWQVTSINFRWYRNVGDHTHTDQAALKYLLAVLNLHGSSQIDIFTSLDKKECKTITVDPGDLVLFRESGLGAGNLPHRVHAPTGDGLRLIALLAYVPGGF